jgi:hypothetical protein
MTEFHAFIELVYMALPRDGTGATHLLLVPLEGGQYWPRQTGWRGSKSVELGSGYVLPLPWLTSVETPVSVLQLTGVLVGRDERGSPASSHPRRAARAR